MSAMTTGYVEYSFPDCNGNTCTVELHYDSTVQDSQGNTVGGWVGTYTLPAGSSYKQQTKRTVGGETNVGVFSGTLKAQNNAGTWSSNYTMATAGFEALGLRVKEQVAPTLTVSVPTANQKFNIDNPTFSFHVVDAGAESALTTTEGNGDSGLNLSSVSITLDGTTYTGSSLTSAFNTTTTADASGGGYTLTAQPKTGLSATAPNEQHSISISISDNDGNTATSSSISFICDISTPDLSVTSPASTSVTTNLSTYHIMGTTSDDETSPVSVVVTVGSTDYTATVTNGAFDVEVTLTQGASNSITVAATNQAGGTTTWTGTIVQNNTIPVFDWVRVEDNPTTAGSVITITAFISNSIPT